MQPFNPPDPPLDEDEQSVLGYLMAGEPVRERTLDGIAEGFGLEKQKRAQGAARSGDAAAAARPLRR